MRSFENALLQVDTSQLRTERDLSHAADAYLPVVLRDIGEEIAADVWDRCSSTITDEHAPFSKPEKRDEYIRSAGEAFAERFSARTKKLYREMILDRLRNLKRR